MTDKKPIIDEQIEAMAEAEEIPVQQAAKRYVKRSDFVFELDNLQPQTHNWVDRGAVMSCEGVHANHKAWKR